MAVQTSVDEVGAQVLRDVNNRSDQHVVGFFGVENMVRLMPVSTVPSFQFVGRAANAWECREQFECFFKARAVCVGLVATKHLFSKSVDFNQLLRIPVKADTVYV